MKIVAWILVIWIVVSLVYGTAKDGAGWLEPFKEEYKYQLRERPLITIIVTILIGLILWLILF